MSNDAIIRKVLQLFMLCLAILSLYLIYILFPFYRMILVLFLQVLAPFFIAALIAYLLHPVVKYIQTFRIPRPIAIIVIYLLFFAVVGIGTYISLPILIKQTQELGQNLPVYVEAYRSFIYDIYLQTSFLPEGFHDKLDQFLADMEEGIGKRITGLLMNIPMLFDVVIMIVLIPVLAFYFLKDYQTLQKGVLRVIPAKYRGFMKKLGNEIEESLGQYIRGQIFVCFLVGLASFLLLKWAGMSYAAVLAMIMGFTNFIPYFGPIIGAIPAILIAFTISTEMILYVLGIVIIIQLLESNLLSPFIVGKSIRIHPVYLMLTLFFLAKATGIIGVILAIPLLAVAKVAVPLTYRQLKRLRNQKSQSE
ncbi:AI-2E family transporter [Gracilibacillus alcaliphilus]|uniref:AI-2E family transporter n=1 Tax=Gracilibacillus alcaliphilus TaxID=1401441 RepID=UPI001EF8F608|nr:AI-2E family transporter [Gracilibacillus alcaliphilus]MBM7679390.1 putative PurR-regulated permease PerM [Gracilibacillus alcaliphilus]